MHEANIKQPDYYDRLNFIIIMIVAHAICICTCCTRSMGEMPESIIFLFAIILSPILIFTPLCAIPKWRSNPNSYGPALYY